MGLNDRAENLNVEIFTPSADLDGRGTCLCSASAVGAAARRRAAYPHLFFDAFGRGDRSGPE